MKFLIFISAIILSISTAFACGCSEPKSILYTSEFANEIFIGRVVSQGIEEIKTNEGWRKAWKMKRHHEEFYTLFEVEKKWKGSSRKLMKVFQPSTCAFPFERSSQPYLVYASNQGLITLDLDDSDDILSTWACIRNARPERYLEGGVPAYNDSDSLDLLFPEPVALSKITPQHEQIFWYLLVFVAGIGVGVAIMRRRLSRAAVK